MHYFAHMSLYRVNPPTDLWKKLQSEIRGLQSRFVYLSGNKMMQIEDL